jgi:hypothetical protein
MTDTTNEATGGGEELTGDRTDSESSDVQSYDLTAAEQVDMAMRQILADQLGENVDAEGVPDYYDVFDWDPNPTVTDYYAMALRNPYAYAVTFLPPMTTWRDAPRIVDDDEDADGQTDFEERLETLVRKQNLWDYGSRADMLAGIGTFGVLVMEFDDVERGDVGDGKENDGFASPVDNPDSLQGLKPFSRESVEDVKLGSPGSGRWGKPVKYQLNLGDENDEEFGIERSGPETMWVHHSRVIHIHADQLLDDDIRGIPRQQPVYNNIVDIEKTLGSAGELAYRASAWGININISKDFQIDDDAQEKLREHLSRWQHGLENVLRTHGADDVKSLGGEDIDPSNVIDPNVEAISAQTGIPQSVLKGNETGERATTQDLKEWYGKIQERREEFVTPTIVRELIDRLIKYDILPTPSDGPAAYSVEWSPLAELAESDVADIQMTRAEMLNEWTGGNPDDYFTREQQRKIVEDGVFPSEMEEIEETLVDENDGDVQGQFETIQADAPPALPDGGEEGGD